MRIDKNIVNVVLYEKAEKINLFHNNSKKNFKYKNCGLIINKK